MESKRETKGQGTNNRKTALLVVGCSRPAAAGADDAKVPFEDSYFPGSHGCHTRPPAILRLSLHCGNHNYTCGCLLITARSPDPSRPTAILRGSSFRLVVHCFNLIRGKKSRSRDEKNADPSDNSKLRCTDNTESLKFTFDRFTLFLTDKLLHAHVISYIAICLCVCVCVCVCKYIIIK